MKRFIQRLILAVLIFGFTWSCEKDSAVPKSYQTKNVIIVVIDGPRYSETWGDPTHQHIPRLANQLSAKGAIYTNFYNNGPTYTNAGHTAISTGNYQEINNSGLELPQNPSIFQHWLKASEEDSTAAWVIASKDKLEVLADCYNEQWHGQYQPATNCGVDGLGTGYREDSITYEQVREILAAQHPRLVLINLRAPDSSGHGNDWEGYLEGISASDEYVYRIWEFLESDSFYKDSTSLFVTNDHGRHLDGIADGFISHGDDCEGCRHINLFACGPDFNEGSIIETERDLTDITATIAELLDFEMPDNQGEVMYELFK